MNLKATAFNATLKSSGDKPFSTDRMVSLIATPMANEGVETETIRLADFNIKPGVTSDEGDGDEWPGIRQKILDADILILGSPIWMGQPDSISKRVLERMDAFFDEIDDQGRMVSYGKVAAELYQALNDVGFTLAPNAVAYWVGEAMGGLDFVDLPQVPEAVRMTVELLARNTVHLAKLI